MARLFNDGASDKLENTAASWSLPISMAAWFRLDAEPGNFVIVSLGDVGSGNYISLRTFAGGDILAANAFDGAGASSEHTTDLNVDIWYHGLAVFTSTTSRLIYLDGDAGTPNTALKIVTLDNTTIGVSADNTPFGYFDGEIAEVAIWEGALTVADALMLANGDSPLFVKPQFLKAYWPLIRGLNDRVGGFNMTASGTVVTAHPRVIYPSKIWVPHIEVEAPPAGIAVLRRRIEAA